MTADLELAPAGTIPSTMKTAVGADDQCSWIEWDELAEEGRRCKEPATDTVRGKLYCGPHADKTAGI